MLFVRVVLTIVCADIVATEVKKGIYIVAEKLRTSRKIKGE